MKQGSMETDRLKPEGRHSLHRRKMSKNTPVLNGDVEPINRTLVRELNYAVAAAFHDHLSCTKAAHDICTLDSSKESRVNNISCETDHVYANCSDSRNKTNVATRPSSPKEITSSEVSKIIISHSEIIGNLRKQLALKDQVIKRLRNHLDRNHRKHRMCLLQKRHQKQTETTGNTQTNCTEANTNHSFINSVEGQTSNLHTPVLATRYFGRRSKTVPSRALKRRYLGPPKTVPVKALPSASSSLPSTPSAPEVSETPSVQQPSESIPLKIHKKRGRKPKKVLIKRDHLTTDSEYFLPDNQSLQHSYSFPQIDVPLWKLKPVTSFYQMEGTENLNDPVFERRHMKCELDERRRKRWDMQRLREQKVSQKLKYKYYREIGKDGENNVQRKPQSFYPDPRHIEFIEVVDFLPVTAFGYLIPLFQPSEFSLPWMCQQKETLPVLDCNSNIRGKKSRHSTQTSKVT